MSSSPPEPVRLLTYANSPFGAKVYWALQYKGVDFELTYVNPLSRREIAFTKQRLVPVLEIGGDWVQAPSFPDLGAFAEIAFCTTYEFEDTLNVSSSPAVGAWYHRMRECLPEKPTPALFPQWPPTGF